MVDDEFGESGFYRTGDGAVIAGQPHVSDTWFPRGGQPGRIAPKVSGEDLEG